MPNLYRHITLYYIDYQPIKPKGKLYNKDKQYIALIAHLRSKYSNNKGVMQYDLYLTFKCNKTIVFEKGSHLLSCYLMIS